MGDIYSFLVNYRRDYKTVMDRVWFEGGDLELYFRFALRRQVLCNFNK